MGKKVFVYLEGGHREDDTDLTQGFIDDNIAARRAWSKFVQAYVGESCFVNEEKLRFVMGGSGAEVVKMFCDELTDRSVLLIDSEKSVPTKRSAKGFVLEALKSTCIAAAREDQVFLMVQCMETWFVADPDNMARYYKHSSSTIFDRAEFDQALQQELEKLRTRRKAVALEQISKGRKAVNIIKIIQAAGVPYSKTGDGLRLMEFVNPHAVARQCPRAEAFLIRLRDLLC